MEPGQLFPRAALAAPEISGLPADAYLDEARTLQTLGPKGIRTGAGPDPFQDEGLPVIQGGAGKGEWRTGEAGSIDGTAPHGWK